MSRLASAVKPRLSLSATGHWLLHSRHGVASIAQTIVVRFALAALNVGTGVITARSLNAGGRGEQSAMLLWPALVCYLLTLGIPAALRYCIRKAPARQAEYFTVSVYAALVLSVVAIGAGVAFIPLWLHAYAPAVIRDAQILMAFAPEIMLGLILTGMLEALGEFRTANITRYLPVLATLIALGALAATHILTPFLSALAYVVPPTFVTLWLLWRLRGSFTLRAFNARPIARALGSYGLRAYGIDILTTLSAQVDQVLVIGLLSATQMGVYVIALAVSRVPQILHTAVVTVVTPTATGLKRDDVIAMVGRAARTSSLIAVVFSACLAALEPFLIPLVYGTPFEPAVRVAQVLTAEAAIGGLVFVLAQTFMALGRPGLLTVLQGLGLAVTVPTMLLLVPRFGLIGAALALLISTCARLGFLLCAFPLILKVPVPPLVPSMKDLNALLRALPQTVG